MYLEIHEYEGCFQILRAVFKNKPHYFNEDFNLVEYEKKGPTWDRGRKIIKFEISRFPNKSNVRKRYFIDDKVYCVSDGVLKFGTIRSKYRENRYVVKFDENFNIDLIPEHLIIPSNWFLLHERCKIGMYETYKCLLRLNIYFDLRILIAKYIWETRNDEEWVYPKCEENQTFNSYKSFFQ